MVEVLVVVVPEESLSRQVSVRSRMVYAGSSSGQDRWTYLMLLCVGLRSAWWKMVRMSYVSTV